MDDAFGVCGIQRIGDLDAQIENFLDQQRFAIHVPAQRFAFDEFHRQEWSPVLLADIMHRADVGVIQRGSSQRFPAKPLQRLRIVH